MAIFIGSDRLARVKTSLKELIMREHLAGEKCIGCCFFFQSSSLNLGIYNKEPGDFHHIFYLMHQIGQKERNLRDGN